MNKLYYGDCITFLENQPPNTVDLVYIDPPFNTQKTQVKLSQRFLQMGGGRVGFGGKEYSAETVSKFEYSDKHSDYLSWMKDILSLARFTLKDTGSIYVHLDWREVHYVKVLMDELYGQDNFLNEIIWAWDYGARTDKYWPRKHNNILWYSKTDNYHFDINECDRIEYMSPKLVGAEKVERGKTATDCHWITIVPTNSKEKTGWPNQKPEKLLNRLISTSCPVGGKVLDFFAGSGTTGKVAADLEREFILCEKNPDALKIIEKRLLDNEIMYNLVKLKENKP